MIKDHVSQVKLGSTLEMKVISNKRTRTKPNHSSFKNRQSFPVQELYDSIQEGSVPDSIKISMLV